MLMRIAELCVGHLRLLFGRAASRAVLLCLTVSGCMTLGDHTPPPAVPADQPLIDAQQASLMTPEEPAVPSKVKPRKPPREVREAPSENHPAREKTAAIDPGQLIGKSPDDVKKLMGAPTKIRDDHLSREWVYSSPGCNFRVFFYPNLNAASFRALKYGGSDSNGGLLAVSNVCVRKILTARANAAD